MDTQWTVVFETAVLASVRRWGRIDQLVLVALRRVLIKDGPAGLDLDSWEFAEAASWSDIDEPHTVRYVVNDQGRLYSLFLEVRPGRTVIVREAGARPRPH